MCVSQNLPLIKFNLLLQNNTDTSMQLSVNFNAFTYSDALEIVLIHINGGTKLSNQIHLRRKFTF